MALEPGRKSGGFVLERAPLVIDGAARVEVRLLLDLVQVGCLLGDGRNFLGPHGGLIGLFLRRDRC